MIRLSFVVGVHQFKEQPLFLDDGEVELLGADGNEVYWKKEDMPMV